MRGGVLVKTILSAFIFVLGLYLWITSNNIYQAERLYDAEKRYDLKLSNTLKQCHVNNQAVVNKCDDSFKELETRLYKECLRLLKGNL